MAEGFLQYLILFAAHMTMKLGAVSYGRVRIFDCLQQSVSGLFVLARTFRVERQTETVTLRKVAGMEVPPFVLWFCAFASSTSCL
jgi:hypothetical protein